MLFSTLSFFKILNPLSSSIVFQSSSIVKCITRNCQSTRRKSTFKPLFIYAPIIRVRPNSFQLCSINLQFMRDKYSKKPTENKDELTDDETEFDWKSEVSDKDSQVIKIKVNSLRTDLIVKGGTGTARNKVEALFYQSKIRVNGQKIFKKSSQLKVGDEIDVIRGPSLMNSDFLVVSRIEILSANEREDGTLAVHLRRYKSLTIENYADPWKGTV